VEDLSKFNSQLAIEVENMRSQSKATKTESDIETKRLSQELEHVRGEVQQLQALVDGSRRAKEDLDDVKVEYQRLQAQNARTEASLKDKMAALDSSRQMIKWTSSLLEAEKKKVAEAEQSMVAAEKQYREMEESWRQQMTDNTNKLVQMNNRRLEEQASQYQNLIADEQEKQKAMRERVKKAKQAAAHSAQKYDEMVLENEALLMQLEELKVATMRTYRDQQRAAAEEQLGSISAMIRGRPQNAHRQL
jgi:chromosome segregation ATPase